MTFKHAIRQSVRGELEAAGIDYDDPTVQTTIKIVLKALADAPLGPFIDVYELPDTDETPTKRRRLGRGR